MYHRSLSHLVISLLTCLIFFSPYAQANEVRVFTNKNGKAIEAELISVSGSKAEIRRKSDGRIFMIEISDLSPEDGKWISTHAPRRDDDWQILQVRLPNPTDEAGVIGLSPSVVTRVGGSDFEILLPLGAWVKLIIYGSDKSGEYFKHLVRFDGADHWTIVSENGVLKISKDGGVPGICGVTLPRWKLDPESEISEFVKGVNSADFSDSLSLHILNDVSPDVITSLGWPVAAFVFDNSVNQAFLKPLARLEVEAASVKNGEDVLNALKSFTALKALDISNNYYRSDGNSTVSVYEDRRFQLPQLRDLTLHSFFSSKELRDSLSKIEGLRLFRQISSRVGDAANLPPDPSEEWNDVNRFADLESLDVAAAVRLSAYEVASLPKLRALVINDSTISNEDPKLSSLFGIRTLRQLSIRTSKFGNDLIDQWAASGGLAELRVFEGYRGEGFDRMPELENLSILRNDGSNISIAPASFASLPRLNHLLLENASASDLAALSFLPHPDELAVIRLHGGNFESLEALKVCKGLRNLEIHDVDAPLDSVDISSFAGLEFLELRRISKLQEVRELSAHPTLQGFGASFCPLLASLGAPHENSILRTFRLADCPGIATLSGLSLTSRLTSMSIYRCEILSPPLEIDELNPNACIDIAGCPNIPDKRPLRF